MAYRMGDPVHSTIRCPKPDCNRLLINDEPCGCTWRDPAEPADSLIGQAMIAIDDDGRVIASGIVTAADRTGDDLELTLTQYPA